MDALKTALPYPEGLDDLEPENIEANVNDMPGVIQAYGLKSCKTREEMLTALGNWYRATESRLAGFEAQWSSILEAYQADKRRLTNKLEFIEKCIPIYLEAGEEFINESVDLRSKPSVSVEVIDNELIPIEYSRVRTEADKIAIKAALEQGIEVPGVALKTKWNLSIKPGGIRAIENAKKRMKKLEGNTNGHEE